MRRSFGSRVLVVAMYVAAGCGDEGAHRAMDAGGVDAMIEVGDAAPEHDAGAEAECPEGFPLGDFYGKPTVQVHLGEHGPFVFVYDTGAPSSGIDDDVHGTVGDGPYDLEVGGREIEVPYMRPFDATALGFDGIDGILGGDVMGSFAVTLDVERRVFWLDEERDERALLACDHVEGDPAETAMAINQYLYVRGTAEDEEGWFLVDSGASLGAMPDDIFDRLQERRPRPALGGFYTPAAIGTFWARLSTVGRLEVAGRAVENIATRTLPDDLLPGGRFSDGRPLLGVLPSGYLRHFLVTVDHPNDALRLDAYTSMPLREPAQYFPVGIGLEDSTDPPFRVAQVLAGSSADEQGVEVGDEVLRVNGRAVAAMSPSQRPWSLVRPGPGETVGVTLVDGEGAERTMTLEARDLLVAPPIGD